MWLHLVVDRSWRVLSLCFVASFRRYFVERDTWVGPYSRSEYGESDGDTRGHTQASIANGIVCERF